MIYEIRRGKEVAEISPERSHEPLPRKRRGLAVCGGRPEALALADWLEELAVYGEARNPLDSEIAYQLSLVVENLYLVRLALNLARRRISPGE